MVDVASSGAPATTKTGIIPAKKEHEERIKTRNKPLITALINAPRFISSLTHPCNNDQLFMQLAARPKYQMMN